MRNTILRNRNKKKNQIQLKEKLLHEDLNEINKKKENNASILFDRVRNIAMGKKKSVKIKQKTASLSTLSWAQRCCLLLGIILGFLFIILICIILFYEFPILSPQCPYIEGRLCNNRGQCTKNAVCECDTLYSGEACTETQVPGYDIETNTECSGNGFANPFILLPSACSNSWLSQECEEYVREVRNKIVERGGNPIDTPEAATIPVCNCKIPYIGTNCLQVTRRIIDENGFLCSGHGNTSVGFVFNATNAGFGAQCNKLTGFFEPEIYSQFSQSARLEITRRYYVEFNTRYCGTIFISPTVPDVMFLYTQEEDYACFCNSDYTGINCGEGRCPTNPQTNIICNGNGHPEYGFGLAKNVNYNRSNENFPCQVNCNRNYKNCINRNSHCVYDQPEGEILFDESTYCGTPQQCPRNRPLRCRTMGECVRVPSIGSSKYCSEGFTTGVIDYSQIQIPVDTYKCQNITREIDVTNCFKNITDIDSITGLLPGKGGMVLNGNLLNINLNSPLIYFEMVLQSLNNRVRVTSYTGQNITSEIRTNNDTYTFTGIFKYSEEELIDNSFISDGVNFNLELVENEEGDELRDYYISPMPFNYSSLIPFPSNYSLVRLGNPLKDVFYTFDSLDTDILLTPVTNISSVDYVIVEFPPTLEIPEKYYFYPTQINIVPPSTCLSEPSLCSWRVDRQNLQIRNLQNNLFICKNLDGQLFVQGESCQFDYNTFPLEYIFSWETRLLARSKIDISTLHLDIIFNTLERNYTIREDYSFNISFIGAENNNTIYELTLLTQDRLSFPCACDEIALQQNRTVINNIWFEDSIIRKVEDVEIGDYLLGAKFYKGQKQLIRSKVVDFDQIAETLVLSPLKSRLGDNNFTTYYKNARVISERDTLQGWSDANLTINPFRCPDGTESQANSHVRFLDTKCNCTYEQPITNCSCSDIKNFNCLCNSTSSDCECGYPTGVQFERELFKQIEELTSTSCKCLINTVEETQNNIFYPQLNTLSVSFGEFPFNSIPKQINLELLNNCEISTFTIKALSNEFTDLEFELPFKQSRQNCSFSFLFEIDEEKPWQNITITSSLGVISSGSLVFSESGFSLLNLDTPAVISSSNMVDAENTLVGNSTYWLSSSLLSEIPVYIQYNFNQRFFVNKVVVHFYKVGSFIDANTTIPHRVWLQAKIREQTNWYTLGSFGLYVPEGGFANRSFTMNQNVTYDTFRLVSPSGQFGIRYWDLFTNQDCECEDGSKLIVQLESTEGLVTIQDELDNINFHNDNIPSTENCICEDNCNLLYANKSFNFANDGICEDVTFIASQRGIQEQTILTNQFNFSTYNNISNIYVFTGGVSIPENNLITAAVQITNSTSNIASVSEIEAYYDTYISGDPIPIKVDVKLYYLETLNSKSSASYVYITPNTLSSSLVELYFIIPTEELIERREFENTFNNLVQRGLACETGQDCSDCGPTRLIPLMTGFTCSLTPTQIQLTNDITNRDVFNTNKTYLLTNFTNLVDPWVAYYQNIPVIRESTVIDLLNCTGQTCPFDRPVKCISGKCVSLVEECDTTYDCPGNGCVEQLDIQSTSPGAKVYRCACAPGFSGDACQFSYSRGAQPYSEFSVPCNEETVCGGPPPLREKPPVLNIAPEFPITNSILEDINVHITGNSFPKSSLDVDYHKIMPQNAPWGKCIKRRVILPFSPGVVTPEENTIYTSCPCARKGFRGEYILLTDDVVERNPFTGEVLVWKNYTNPATGQVETFPWTGICTYDDFPLRCPNGQCVANSNYCERSNSLFPICNGRGICKSDGSCECFSGFRTFSISNTYTQFIQFPYYFDIQTDLPDPTIWELNWNWKHHGLNQCTARNCNEILCEAEVGCFPGTFSLNFQDREILCPKTTGKLNRCGRSLEACFAGTDLTFPKQCSGKGIPRRKDFTGEEYCYCGDPISTTVDIRNISQITQLKPNGWGGPTCSDYFASPTEIVWSSWNWEVDEPHRSIVTGDILPGIWEGFGGVPIGPDPEQILLWDECCPGYDRFELCPYVPCRQGANLICTLSEDCLSPNTPQVYPCNNHGVARKDGTCECDTNIELGEGYTFDFTEFGYKGCFKRIQCPVSSISGESCNYVPACTKPEEWRHPLPVDQYLEQQWFICGLEGGGEYSNITLVDSITNSVDNFNSQLLDAASDIAVSVLEAEAGLRSCICVYPNDTQTDKFGMLPGANLRYRQNFNKPFLLNGTIVEYPTLVDDVLNSFRSNTENIRLNQGDTFNFTLGDNLLQDEGYILAAVRLFQAPIGQGGSTLSFETTGGSILCPTVTITNTSVVDFLSWTLNVEGEEDEENVVQAHYCGPTFECLDMREQAEYEANCGISINSQQCIDFKRDTCDGSVNSVYWPEDSKDSYQGCSRDQDIDGCVCCQQQSILSLNTFSNNQIKVTVEEGSILLGEIRFYGYTNEAQDMPTGLRNYLDRSNVAGPSTCSDDRFLTQFLEADNSFYAPPDLGVDTQEPRTRELAKQRCEETGGFLAITDNSLNLNDVSPVTRVCENLLESTGICWVNGRERTIGSESELFEISRNELFLPKCTENGCFHDNLIENLRLFTFYEFKSDFLTSNKYTSASFPDQVTTKSFFEQFENPFYSLPNAENPTFVVPQSPDQTIGSAISLENGLYSKIYLSNTKYPPAGEECNIRIIHFDTSDSFFTLRNADSTFTILSYNNQWGRFETSPLFSTNDVWMEPAGCAYINFYKEEYCDLIRGNRELQIVYQGNGVGYGPYIQGFSTDERGGILSGSTPEGGTIGNYAELNRLTKFFNGGKFPFEMCFKFFPKEEFHLVRITPFSNPSTDGVLGVDWFPGYNEYEYLPGFMRVEITKSVNAFELNNYRNGEILIDNDIPVYFTEDDLQKTFSTFYDNFSDDIIRCDECIITLDKDFAWDQKIYSQQTWKNLFTPDEVFEIQVKPINEPFSPISSFEFTRLQFYSHQIVFIQNYNNIPTPTILWDFNSCAVVSSNGLGLSVCKDIERNFVCQYDYTRYAIVNGYDCPACGPNTRTGGADLPGITCFQDFPLANATAFPFEHELKDSYLRGTLDLYVESFNIQSETINYENVSVIWGFEQAWLKWSRVDTENGVSGYSDRPGRLIRGFLPNQNWCDLSLKNIWNFDCGVQRHPITNVITRVCASELEFCNLNIPMNENPLMRQSEIPPIYLPVSELNRFSDSTCGPNIFLRSYFISDKYGGKQTDLDDNQIVLELEFSFIEIQLTLESQGDFLGGFFGISSWFNAGKTPHKYIFEWNNTASIFGEYQIFGCTEATCADAKMDIFIHPLDVNYVPPTNLIQRTINLVTTTNQIENYLVNFTLSEQDTGVTIVSGESFPTNVFRGVGYKFRNLPVGSSIRLYNPVITDSKSRKACGERVLPEFKEAKIRIDSTAPFRKCIITDDDQELFPGKDKGECACSLDSAGVTCDCPAVTSKFGKEVCGGFGDPGVKVLNPADVNQLLTTGTGTETGCFIYNQGENFKRSDCKTVDIGRVAWTLQVPGAVFDYPSVYIETAPQSGEGLFLEADNLINEGLFIDTIRESCKIEEAARLPYFFTDDELNQLVRKFQNSLPIFLGVEAENTGDWLWTETSLPSIYMIKDNSGVLLGEEVDFCLTDFDTCEAINFNNLAFNISSPLTDGNVNNTIIPFASTISWTSTASLEVDIYVWQDGGQTISCEPVTSSTSCFLIDITLSYTLYRCRCPTRVISYSDAPAAEIQIFDSRDNMRSQVYIY